MTSLADLDLTLDLSKKEEAARLAAAQERLLALRLTMGGLMGGSTLGPPLCVVFEGGDASGKGGAIKRLVDRLDPRHVRVASIAAPTYDEKRHHFLHRFGPALPGWGGMAILDRSWYGRVLVERVEGFCSEEEWRRAYHEINEFEAHQASFGMVVQKFWLHLSKEEQLRRFQTRERDPFRSHKLTAEDWRNRARWAEYEQAVEEMLDRTSTAVAPWTVVEADDKLHARVKVVRTLADAVEKAVG